MEKSLLLVEDDKAQQGAWKTIFEQLGRYKVTIAKNGKDGLEKLSEIYEIIVLDVSMPQMNGIEFVKEFYLNKKYEKYHHIPIMMLTVWTDLDKVKNIPQEFPDVMLFSKTEDDDVVVNKMQNFIKSRARQDV
jgi:CheY-like chemotaxis protein